MRSIIVTAALLISPPALASELGVGVSGDLGVFIRGLTVGTGGIGAYGSTGIGGVGGKLFFKADAGLRVGVSGAVDWDLSRYYDAQLWWVGGDFAIERPIGEGRFAGGGVGIGYGQADESIYDYFQDYLYFRTHSTVRQVVGPLGLEVGVYVQLPIVLSQSLRGQPVNLGWIPWMGAEVTIYFNRSSQKKPPPQSQDEANRRPPPPPPEDRPLAIPGDEPPPPPPPR